MDPLEIYAPMLEVGPAGSIMLDVIALLAVAVALAGEALDRRGVSLLQAGLFFIGAGAAAAHAWLVDGGSIDNLFLGSAWTAAMAGGLAMAHLCRHERMRRLTLALAIGVIGLLAAKGTVQVLWEHPQMLRDFRLNRESILASQGWTLDSPMAKSYERRLSQADATGWFGLSNVYSSFAAAGLVGLVGWLLHSVRCVRAGAISFAPVIPILLLGVIASAVALLMSHSKGGYAAAAAGLGIVLVLQLRPIAERALRHKRPLAMILGIGAVAVPLGAIALRGVIGERIGELSILFRSFYTTAALRIFGDHPLLGVGPGDFKDAYLLAKPALSPEEVNSPHSLLFDFSSTLGLLGCAWLVLFGFWLIRGAGALFVERTTPYMPRSLAWNGLSETKLDAYVVFAIIGIAGCLSAFLELAGTTPDIAIARVVGVILWAAFALAAMHIMRCSDGWKVGAVAAALALAAHAQIETTPVWPTSAALFFLIFGALAARSERPAPRRSTVAFGPPLGVLAAALVLLVAGLVPAARWQGKLAQAAHAVEPLAQIKARLTAIGDGPDLATVGRDSLAAISQDLGQLLNRPPPTSSDTLAQAMDDLHIALAQEARSLLAEAAAIYPAHPQTARTASRLCLDLAIRAHQLGLPEQAAAFIDEAEQIAATAAQSEPQRASSWAWMGMLNTLISDLDPSGGHLDAATQAWETAARLDPYGLPNAVRLYETALKMGDTDSARIWAAKALEIDDLLRLDTIKGLGIRRKELVRFRDSP